MSTSLLPPWALPYPLSNIYEWGPFPIDSIKSLRLILERDSLFIGYRFSDVEPSLKINILFGGYFSVPAQRV